MVTVKELQKREDEALSYLENKTNEIKVMASNLEAALDAGGELTDDQYYEFCWLNYERRQAKAHLEEVWKRIKSVG